MAKPCSARSLRRSLSRPTLQRIPPTTPHSTQGIRSLRALGFGQDPKSGARRQCTPCGQLPGPLPTRRSASLESGRCCGNAGRAGRGAGNGVDIARDKSVAFPTCSGDVLFLLFIICKSLCLFHCLRVHTTHTHTHESWRNGNTFPECHPPILSACSAYFPNILSHQPRCITLAFCPQLRTRHWILGFFARLLLM